MGRPIKKKWFGTPVTAGSGHIKVNGVKWADGTTATNVYILRQVGSTAYIVTNGTTKTEIVFMVNATAVGSLLAGQCFILATPFGGSAIPCEKIAQHRVYTYESNGTKGTYSWTVNAATALGQATLVQ